MKQEQDLYDMVVESLKKRANLHRDATKKLLGKHPGMVEMSTDKQLEAYDAMTPQESQMMIQQKGLDEFNKYVSAMLVLKARRKG